MCNEKGMMFQTGLFIREHQTVELESSLGVCGGFGEPSLFAVAFVIRPARIPELAHAHVGTRDRLARRGA
jgi:hypothetical protein